MRERRRVEERRARDAQEAHRKARPHAPRRRVAAVAARVGRGEPTLVGHGERNRAREHPRHRLPERLEHVADRRVHGAREAAVRDYEGTSTMFRGA